MPGIQTAKQCDKAMVYSMKNDLHPEDMEKAQSFVQLTFESLKEMQSNKGNMENAYGFEPTHETPLTSCAHSPFAIIAWSGSTRT